jgi:hypothetical protein
METKRNIKKENKNQKGKEEKKKEKCCADFSLYTHFKAL